MHTLTISLELTTLRIVPMTAAVLEVLGSREETVSRRNMMSFVLDTCIRTVTGPDLELYSVILGVTALFGDGVHSGVIPHVISSSLERLAGKYHTGTCPIPQVISLFSPDARIAVSACLIDRSFVDAWEGGLSRVWWDQVLEPLHPYYRPLLSDPFMDIPKR